MSGDKKLVLFTEEYENEKTGEKVAGVTVLIDGMFKQTLDIIMQKEGNYHHYTEIIRDLLFAGVNSFISKYK